MLINERPIHISMYLIVMIPPTFFSYPLCRTRPKTKFPTCPVYQNMQFPHISYTYLAEDRAEFHENEQNV